VVDTVLGAGSLSSDAARSDTVLGPDASLLILRSATETSPAVATRSSEWGPRRLGMSPADSSSNGGVPSSRVAAVRSGGTSSGSESRREATIEGLTVALSGLRRGAAALKAENHQLRGEVGQLRRNGVVSPPEFGRLVEIAVPTGARAPGAARRVVAHCLSRLVTPGILDATQLLVSELVTNSVRHAELDTRDTVLMRIYVAAESLRVEVENPGAAGVVALHRPDREVGRGFGLQLLELVATRWGVRRARSTTVWFDMARA
jgi:anti-sigma regulatory factor (Ser/Thr protein kinase)